MVGYDFNLKLLQYADDTLFFVPDETSLKGILYELNKFGEVAGPRINKEKTVMIWLGDTGRSWNLEKHDLKWTHKPIRYPSLVRVGINLVHALFIVKPFVVQLSSCDDVI